MNAIPTEIKESIKRFRRDYPDPEKVAFLMMQYGRTRIHSDIVEAIRNTLSRFGLTAVRADDKQYHDDIFYNIQTYLYGCGFGIAIFERLEADYFNPNVSLEIGFMIALSKKVCLLKDKNIKTLHSDLVGRLYCPFDIQNSDTTIKDALTKWMLDLEIIKPDQRKEPIRIEELERTISSGDMVARNIHELRFIKIPERNVEIDLIKSIAEAPMSTLQITFVFAHPHFHPYIDQRWKTQLTELMNDGSLTTHCGGDWLTFSPSEYRFDGWTIDGKQLVKEFPDLKYLTWLDREFHCRADFKGIGRFDEPANSYRVAFVLDEPDESLT